MRHPLCFGVRLSACLAVLFASACRRAAEPAEADPTKPVEARQASSTKLVQPASEVRPTTEQWLARILASSDIADAAERKRALAGVWAEATGEERALLLEALWALGEDRGARARFAELFTLWCEGEPESAARWAVSM